MNNHQQHCQQELEEEGLIPRKYYGQVFTTDPKVIDQLIDTIKSVYRPGTKIVEIGGGLGYITEKLMENFEDVDVLEIDNELFEVLKKKVVKMEARGSSSAFDSLSKSSSSPKAPLSDKSISILKKDILEYEPPKKDYLLVGNIPFHISGKLYRRFMSDLEHKPYATVFITDKQYASTLMGQPPRCYRVSLQAQAYGDIEIVADVPPESVHPEPKVMSCIMKIIQNDLKLPNNFWEVVNYHFENFPTKEVESPKTVGLQGWLELCRKSEAK